MAINTVLAFWTDQRTKAEAALVNAQADLKNAQTKLTAQRANLSTANQELADLAKQTAQIRADLAEAVTPADVDALESKRAKAISDTRAKQAEIISIEAAVDAAQTALDLANANVAAATSRASAVAAALEAADQRDRDLAKVGSGQAVRASDSVTISGLTGHPFIEDDVITVTGMKDTSFDGEGFTIGSVTATSITYPQEAASATSGGCVVFGLRALRLRHNLQKPPLSTMVVDATDFLAAKPWTDARARIEADIPQELRECAKERAKVELKRLENDNKRADEITKLLGALIADADNRRQLLDSADTDFRDYVINAKSRFDQAQAIAARVADAKQNPLTVAENLSIHNQKPDGSVDTALRKKRIDAAKARLAVATAQIDADAKQTDVDIVRLKALAIDINKNPETDPAVTAAEGLLTTAKTKLNTAKTAFTSDMQTDLTDWQTALPDTTWRNLADFEDAKRLLIDLKDDPGPLVTAMDDAEAVLVASLLGVEKAGRTLDLLESEERKAASRARFDKGNLPRRMLSALRDDN